VRSTAGSDGRPHEKIFSPLLAQEGQVDRVLVHEKVHAPDHKGAFDHHGGGGQIAAEVSMYV